MILPNRTFVSDWILDKRLRRLNPQVQLLLIFLRPLCDVAGRFHWDALSIHSALYRSAECGNVSVRDVEAWLEILRSSGCIKAYVGTDGRRIGEVMKAYWRQTLSYGSAKYEPEPDNPQLPLGADAAPPHPQKRSEEKGTCRNVPAGAGEDEVFLALAKAQGAAVSAMTARERKSIGVAAREIRAACRGMTLLEVAALVGERARMFARNFPTARVTAMALSKHWSSLGPVGAGGSGAVARSPWDDEPEGWRAYWRETYPPEDFPSASRWEEGQWAEIPAMTRRDIFFGLAARFRKGAA